MGRTMQQTNNRFPVLQVLISLLVLAVFAAAAETRADNAVDARRMNSPVKKSTRLNGLIIESEESDTLDRLGIKCVRNTGEKSGLYVSDIKAGSSAYYEGIAAGDKIIQIATHGDGKYIVTICRNAQVYCATLKPLTGAISTASMHEGAKINTNLLTASAQSTKLQGQTAQKLLQAGAETAEFTLAAAIKKLSRYHIELIIDRSGSMQSDTGVAALSRFQWCEQQTADLAELLAPYVRDLTITIFNTQFQTFDDVGLNKVHEIFHNYAPDGGTDMVDPLASRIDAYLDNHAASKKPLLIAVITDGLPNVPPDPAAVRRALIDRTWRMHNPDEIAITFLQIGDDFEGREFLVDMADNLVAEGARYDIADTRTFSELKKIGLVQALIEAVTATHTRNILAEKQERRLKRSGVTQAQVDRLRKLDDAVRQAAAKRQELEKQILGH